jgi:hypothetical protein
MDKATNGEKEVNPKKYIGFEFGLASDKVEEVKKFWKQTDENYMAISKIIERDSQAFLSGKKAFQHIMKLVYATSETLKWTYLSAKAIQDAQERLTVLERIVEEIAQKLDVDFTNVKAEMDQLKATINSPAITVVSKFVEQMNKNIEDYKKKMEENDLAT